MKKIYTTILFLFIACLTLFAQSPKREMRAVWLTTVWRNDWPSTTVPVANGSNEAARQQAVNMQKNGLIAIYNKLQSANINTVYFQIRSMCDAFYPSSYEPWSSFVSATHGSDPGYDPLAFAIEEAHKRGMELHAWINPYRYSSSSATHGNLPTDYAVAHPDWLLDHGNSIKILNPGKPEVVQRISDIVAEVVTNYNLDGIVFDDYFYSDQGTSNAMDQAQYDAYNPDGLSREDWRRANVNKMVKTVYNRIQSIKPYVTFGISPAGVAASNKAVADKYGVPPSPVGSDWQYTGIYSDPLAWLSEGSVDYISPQIYWTVGSSNDYSKLSQWWSQIANHFGKQFYSSHSLSDMGSSAAPPMPGETIRVADEDIPASALSSLERSIMQQSGAELRAFGYSEVGRQVDCNRDFDLNGAPGSVFFATTKATGTGFVNYMADNQFHFKSIPPAISWKPAEAQGMVDNIVLSGQTLSWTYNSDNIRYAVYVVPKPLKEPPTFISNYLEGISYFKQYTLPAGVSAATHLIAVSVVDRYGNESAPRILGENTTSPAVAGLIYPADNATVIMPVTFTWETGSINASYVWQIAEDANFNKVIASRETNATQFNSGLVGNLKDNTRYYWRVKTIKPNAGEVWSETRNFTGQLFRIQAPANGSSGVPLTPSFIWPEMGVAADYTLEISTTNLFTPLVYSATVQTAGHTVPENKLTPGTTYYARVIANIGSSQITSAISSFTTVEMEIPVPQILSPLNESSIPGTTLAISWQEQPAKGFRIELAPSASFSPLNTKVKTTGAFDFSTQYTDLAAGTWYFRVAAQKTTGFTAYSETVKVTMGGTGINEIPTQSLQAYVAGGNLFIQSGNPGLIKVAIYNLTGQLLSASNYTLPAGNNMIPLNFIELNKGIYLIRLQTAEQSLTLKIKL